MRWFDEFRIKDDEELSSTDPDEHADPTDTFLMEKHSKDDEDGKMKKGKWARCEMSTCKWIDSGGLSGGAIAGIIICILALLGIAGGGTWYSKKENKFCFAHQNQGAVQVPMS